MVTVMMVVLAVTVSDPAQTHVRASEPKIQALIQKGLSESETFRRLVATLDQSEVIVYVEPKLTRRSLGAYLAHNIVDRGGYRYLRIAIDIQGRDQHLVPLLAHELQHAVELAQAPDARDPESVEHTFQDLAKPFGCQGTTCYETQAAIDVQRQVSDERRAGTRTDDASAPRIGASRR